MLLLRVLIVLALLVSVLEVGARLLLDPATSPTAIGSRNPILDVKFGMLDRLQAERGVIDCLFVGSSVVNFGIQAAAVEASYTATTGAPLTCYNFGVSALTASGAATLIEVLIDRYHPRVLIYGFTLRALTGEANQGAEVDQQIATDSWLRYQRGEPDAYGWLVDHSAALRHYLPYRHWMRADYLQYIMPFNDAAPDGYAPFIGSGGDPRMAELPDYFRPYHADLVERAALDRILALPTPDTQLMLLAMPLPHFILAEFESATTGLTGLDGYESEIAALADDPAARDVVAWSLTPRDLIPLEEWAEDAFHVNDAGAYRLSTWLGEAFAEAAQAGELSLPHD